MPMNKPETENRREDPRTVIEQMLEECALGYQSGTAPLIFLSTQDRRLVERIALQGHLSGELVPLCMLPEDDSEDLAAYYEYLDSDLRRLDRCVNLSYDIEKLRAFPVDQAGKPPVGPDGQPIELPFLFILRIGEKTSPEVMQVLRDYVRRYDHSSDPQSLLQRSCVLLYGTIDKLADDLWERARIVDEVYPRNREIRCLLEQKMGESGLPRFEEPSIADSIAEDMTGFSLLQAEGVIRTLLLPDRRKGGRRLYDPEQRTKIIQKEKARILQANGGVLELVKLKTGSGRQTGRRDKLCGMGGYQIWVDTCDFRMEKPRQAMRERGLPPMKGILVCGVPGCGKSEAAQLLCDRWDLPLVKMNMDQLMGELVGQSERNLRTALAQAEAMAPVIVWMDEVDKSMSGASSANKNDTTFQRMYSRLLQWMQSNDRGCFIFATANDIYSLPQPFLRRFDERFSVFLPSEKECVEIFEEQMRRREAARNEARREAGLPPAPNLFSRDEETGCFDEKTRKAVMACFGKGRFLNGSDISRLVDNALTLLPEEAFRSPIRSADWCCAMEKAAEGYVCHVSSVHTLNETAACYIRLLRDSFKTAAEEQDLLFQPRYYKVTSVPAGTGADGKSRYLTKAEYDTSHFQTDSAYDRALFETLAEIINRHAADYEQLLAKQSFLPASSRQ